jgi:(2R)-3-sulfolactate dehydrogenase (NADP+)
MAQVSMVAMSMAQLQARVATALQRAGASENMAGSAARALVLAEAQGLSSHGLSRVAQYCTHLRNGRVDGAATPVLQAARGGAVLVDAQDGLAFEACELAVQQAVQRAREFGVSFAGVTNSHHGGVLVDHLRPAAGAGMVGLGFANSPAAMPAAGGRHPVFGTNPVAAVFPRLNADPLLIDLSLSEVARGKLMLAAKAGQPIPKGWALDAEGRPTTDPNAALQGSMLPFGSGTAGGTSDGTSGGTKGSMLALVVELLVTALTGAHFGFEASSFFVDEGNRPRIGQAFIVIDPGALAGTAAYAERLELLVAEMLHDEGVRLPGARREALRHKAEAEGLQVAEMLLQSWAA